MELAIYSEGSISVADAWEMSYSERELAVTVINDRNLKKSGQDPAQNL